MMHGPKCIRCQTSLNEVIPLCIDFVGSHSPPQEGKATQGQKPAHYCTKKPATVLQQKKKLTRQDATHPKQKAVTDYKEQVDSHTTPPHPIQPKN